MRKELKTWAARASEDELNCRDLAHPWQPYTAKQTSKGFERQLYCPRCGSLKQQELSRVGLILKSRIVYTATYILPPGAGRLTKKDKAQIRVACIRNTIAGL